MATLHMNSIGGCDKATYNADALLAVSSMPCSFVCSDDYYATDQTLSCDTLTSGSFCVGTSSFIH